MREWKMRYGQKMQGWKVQEWKNRVQIAGVENAGVGKPYKKSNDIIHWETLKLLLKLSSDFWVNKE